METTSKLQDESKRPNPEIISESFVAVLRAAGVTEAYLFGSHVQGTATDDSDIDVLVHFGPDAGVFAQLDLIAKLSEVSGRSADVVTKVHPAFAPYIEPTLVRLAL